MPDTLSERDEATFRILAAASGTTVAEQRRRALAAAAEAVRRVDPGIRTAVDAALAHRERVATSPGATVLEFRRSS
jgi:hypothetical protein